MAEVRSGGFRHDIDGLRALAIVMVVAFHGAIPGFGGGFVGVDVFFVISGYLIQTNLFRELDRDETVRLGAFWARRVRRLAPAMALVTMTTLVLGVVLLSPLEWGNLAKDGLATSFYVSNFKFIFTSQDYFHGGSSVSYFLHTWSLSVEEQFYIVWPLLLVAVSWVGRRIGSPRVAARITVLSMLSVASFGLSVVLTARGTPWAFFGLPTRAWEFGVAGLLVASPVHPILERRAVQLVLSLIGVGCLAAAVLTTTGATPYPGSAALLPVIGTLAILAVGRASTPGLLSRALSWGPLGWLGRHSYSWYLWHWPLIIFAVVEFGDTTTVKALASFGSLIPAMLTFRFVEQPVRFHPRLVRRVGATFAVGAVLLMVCGGSSVALAAEADHQVSSSRLLQRLRSAANEFHELDVNKCPNVRTTEGDRACVYGDMTSTRTVMLIGDSHALHWVPPLEAAAKAAHVRMVLRFFGGCPAVDVRVATRPPNDMSPHTKCNRYRAATDRMIAELRPEAVIESEFSNYRDAVLDSADHEIDAAARLQTWRDAHARFAQRMKSLGIRLGVIVDGPQFTSDPARCAARAGEFASCARSRTEVTRAAQPFRDAVASTARAAGVPTLSITDLLCGPTSCPLETGGVIIYSDTNHVTGTFARTLTPQFADFLAAVMG